MASMSWAEQRSRPARFARSAVIAIVALAAMLAAGRAQARAGAGAQTKGGQAVTLSGFGNPLEAIRAEAARGHGADLRAFAAGQRQFVTVSTLPQLGPLFNGRSCVECHFQPAVGGSGGALREIRVRDNPNSGPVHIFATDNMLRLGVQRQGAMQIFPQGVTAAPAGCQLTAPGCQPSPCQQAELAATTFSTGLALCDPSSADFAAGSNCTAERQPPPLFGLGLVEAVADGTLAALAAAEPADVRAVARTVTEFGQTRVARFGWKDDFATLRAFSGSAYLQEMGITNPDNPHEISICDQGQSQFGVLLDAPDDPEDTIGPDGRAKIDLFVDFIRALAPPPELTRNKSASAGRRLFASIGCADCHTPTLRTARDPQSFIPATTGGVAMGNSLARALRSRTFHPYSDFLLHDMGSLGDGITSGVAGPTMMRTAPLWGLRAKSLYLHDGRAPDLTSAIELHDGQGKSAATEFGNLSAGQQQELIDFLTVL
jgi:Di-haem oxidoreductase, putative peroxidase